MSGSAAGCWRSCASAGGAGGPRRAAVADPPWLEAFVAAARDRLGVRLGDELAAAMRGPESTDPRARGERVVRARCEDAGGARRAGRPGGPGQAPQRIASSGRAGGHRGLPRSGGYAIRPPQRYLFEGYHDGVGGLLGRFLIRTCPDPHVAQFERPLYEKSEFCAACHEQVPAPGEATTAGLAQEQNEDDSCKEGRWDHGDDDARTLACRECHMPLVGGREPASGDGGKHRSHRALASNKDIPATMQLQGHAEQVRQTLAWLRSEIEVPEIADKWTSGPTVKLEIVAPDRIRAGELVNIGLHLHDNKTGHDFPAGPLDVPESWLEPTAEHGRGNTLMEPGADQTLSPSIEAPVVYKADWYDRQGLPVERHALWDVVGASYRRVIHSGGSDVVDVPFRCPGIARPRLSQSASEAGPVERKSDVVFAIADPEFDQLRVTARLTLRKPNPDFLAQVYEFEPVVQAPVIEIVCATRTIEVTR